MNLCLACRDVTSEDHGGLARSMCDLAEALAQEGHRVHLMTNISDAPTRELDGVSIKRLPVPPASGPCAEAIPESASHNLMHAAAVYREVRRTHEYEQAVDAVLAPLWRSEGVVCLLDGRFPTIVSCMTSLRTLTEIDGAYWLLPDIEERLSLEREALARSRYLHGLTGAVLDKTIGDYELHPHTTGIIGRGLRDRGGEQDHRSWLGAPGAGVSDTAHVLFVGRVERRKGVDVLLAAAGELLDDGVAVDFTFAGPNADPSFRDAFEREARERPRLNAAVHFLGAISDSELYRLYAGCDIVCVPSRYESHGVVLIEAMMFGKPIVTCDAGGVGEVVEAGRDALLSPPDDPAALATSLRLLLANPVLRAKIGRGARQTYERRFDALAVAHRMQSFLEGVIAAHRATADGTLGVSARLQGLLRDVLNPALENARLLAGELLEPPASAWQAWANGL